MDASNERTDMRRLVTVLAILVLSAFAQLSLAQTLRTEGLTDPGFNWSRSWVDINGDGRDDFCILTGDQASNLDCFLSDGTKFGPMQRYSVGPGNDVSGLRWADVNGDGLIDICRVKWIVYGRTTKNVTVQCRLGPLFQTSTTELMTSEPLSFSTASVFMSDVDGDGRADYCMLSYTTLKCHLSTGSGFAPLTSAWTRGGVEAAATGWPQGFYDFNADGYPDFCRVLGTGQLRCTLGSANGFTTDVTSAHVDTPYSEGAAFIDINADGNTDFCRIVGYSGAYRLSCVMSNGVSWETTERGSPPLNVGSGGARWWADINGDGYPDFCRDTASGVLGCRLGRGDGDGSSVYTFGFTDVSVSGVDYGMSDGGRSFCDPTGSGMQTLCRLAQRTESLGEQCAVYGENERLECYQATQNTWGILAGVYAQQQARPQLLTSYTDGLGAETRISYLSTVSPEVYIRSGAGTYPRALISQPKGQVVFETRVWETGTQKTLTGNARYFYKDLLSDTWTGGRGFRERWIFTEGSNTLDHVVYYQGRGPSVDPSSLLDDRRELGLIKYQERFAVANGLVPSTSNVPGLSPRQTFLKYITEAASKLGAITDPQPTTQSPFILLQSTSNTLGDTAPANPRFRYLRSSTVMNWDWNGTARVAMPRTDSVTEMDDVGNVTSIVQTTTAPNGLVWKQTTTNRYDEDNRASWILGRLTSATVKSEAPSADAQIAAYARSAGRSPGASDISSSAPAAPQSISPAVLSAILQLLLDD
jgi:hypothetical protein